MIERVLKGIVATLGQVDGLNVQDSPGKPLVPPAAVVKLARIGYYDDDGGPVGFYGFAVHWEIRLVTLRLSSSDGHAALYQLLDPSEIATGSVIAALRFDPTLGGVCDTSVARVAHSFGSIDDTQTSLLTATLELTTYGDTTDI